MPLSAVCFAATSKSCWPNGLAAKSPYSLYSEDLATFGESAGFEHKDSKGFVKLYGLPGMVAASVRRKAAKAPQAPGAARGKVKA